MDTELAGMLWLFALFALGLLNCFFGYRLFIVTVGIVGFLLAASFGYATGIWMGSATIAIIAALILGLIGGWASVTAYYAFIFVVGAFGFAFLARFIAGLFIADVSILILIIAGAIGGFLALWIQRIIIILATALQGSLASILAVIALISGGGLVAYRRLMYDLLDKGVGDAGGIGFYVGILIWLVLFAAGLGTQFTRGKEMYRRKSNKALEPVG